MPRPPTILPFLYSGTPPPNAIAPPHTLMSELRFASRHSGLNGAGCDTPHNECPGCVSVYRRAVDSASVSVLKPFAVNAFAIEIARLPGQYPPVESLGGCTTHTSPFRFTIAPHSAF